MNGGTWEVRRKGWVQDGLTEVQRARVRDAELESEIGKGSQMDRGLRLYIMGQR